MKRISYLLNKHLLSEVSKPYMWSLIGWTQPSLGGLVPIRVRKKCGTLKTTNEETIIIKVSNIQK